MMTKKKKILVLCGMFVLLVATAVLNFLITQQQSPAADDGQDVLASANFFTQFRSVRTSNRNEEVLYLDSIIETTAAEFEEARQTAMDEKLALVANMELELTLEGLIKAKGFEDVVVSAKAHDVMTTVRTYRLLSREIPQVPLHIGVTEAGTLFQGVIKSASGLGILLEEGIGDTMRISLTDDPVQEMRACWTLLGALDLRRRGPEIISCPTCGRCQVDLIGMAKQVEERLAHVTAPLKVAVMGCVVNGPGEAADADLGVACGAGSGVLFARGEILRKVDESAIVDALLEEIEKFEQQRTDE